MEKARLYETTFIVNASLDDTQVDAVIGRVQDVIVKNGGTANALNKWGRKRLAYSINKKTNGFYVNIEFTAPAPLLASLERARLRSGSRGVRWRSYRRLIFGVAGASVSCRATSRARRSWTGGRAPRRRAG